MSGAQVRRVVAAAAAALVVVALVATLLVSDVLSARSAAQEPAVSAPDVPVRQLERDVVAPLPQPEAGPTPREVDEAAVLAALASAAGPAGADLHAVVVDDDGQVLLATPAADRPVPSASLVKLMVVQQLLDRSAAGELTLGPDDRARMERAITASDDRAMSLLWVDHDGPRLVRESAEEFGLTATAPPEVPGQWGQAWTSAADVARFLAALTGTAATPGAETLLGWMADAGGTAADGFDQRFGLFAGVAGAARAVKQGWMCCVAGERHLHSVGVLLDGRVVSLLAEAPTSSSWAQLRRVVDDAAAALVAGTA